MTTEEADPTTPADPQPEPVAADPTPHAEHPAPPSPGAADEGSSVAAEAPAAMEEADEPEEAEVTDEPEPADAEPPVEAAPAPNPKRWYVIKVASNREDSTKRNIERQMKIDGLEHFIGQIVIPYEEVVEVKKVTDTTKSGDKTTKTKKVIKKIKKFPGYLMAEVEWNAEVQAMLRGVSGVSDFVGAQGIGKPPPPMTDADVQRMLGTHSGGSGGGSGGGAGQPTPGGQKIKEVVKLNLEKGDKVRIRDGAFANFEGVVKGISEPKEAGETPVVTVGVQVLGRETNIEMEFWQVDKL